MAFKDALRSVVSTFEVATDLREEDLCSLKFALDDVMGDLEGVLGLELSWNGLFKFPGKCCPQTGLMPVSSVPTLCLGNTLGEEGIEFLLGTAGNSFLTDLVS